MSRARSPLQLAKILTYMLARRPDEFGLVPDREGYVPVKELLKAMAEEPGWGYVRLSHLNEILLSAAAPPIEIRDAFIRARDRSRLPVPRADGDLPKLLYTCVRQKAHRFTLENGIRPGDRQEIVLCADRGMAERMGRRRDRQAITLTVNVQQARAMGVAFERLAGGIFLSGPIPAGCFSGPPLPKNAPEPPRPPAPAKAPQPGSFTLDLENLGQKGQTGKKPKRRHTETDGKKDARRKRRERPPWRR